MRDADALNPKLLAVYRAVWPRLRSLVGQWPGISSPHLIVAPPSYSGARRRILFVGQQTYTWGRNGDWCSNVSSLPDVLRLYRDFDLGHGRGGYPRKRSPFWQACWRISQSVSNSDDSFVWSNLVKLDLCGRRPPRELESFVAQFHLLKREIRILRPDIVVFFTGHRYDDALCLEFPRATFERIGRTPASILASVRADGLPRQTLRTYHPGYLRRSCNWWIVESLVRRLRAA